MDANTTGMIVGIRCAYLNRGANGNGGGYWNIRAYWARSAYWNRGAHWNCRALIGIGETILIRGAHCNRERLME